MVKCHRCNLMEWQKDKQVQALIVEFDSLAICLMQEKATVLPLSPCKVVCSHGTWLYPSFSLTHTNKHMPTQTLIAALALHITPSPSQSTSLLEVCHSKPVLSSLTHTTPFSTHFFLSRQVIHLFSSLQLWKHILTQVTDKLAFLAQVGPFSSCSVVKC